MNYGDEIAGLNKTLRRLTQADDLMAHLILEGVSHQHEYLAYYLVTTILSWLTVNSPLKNGYSLTETQVSGLHNVMVFQDSGPYSVVVQNCTLGMCTADADAGMTLIAAGIESESALLLAIERFKEQADIFATRVQTLWVMYKALRAAKMAVSRISNTTLHDYASQYRTQLMKVKRIIDESEWPLEAATIALRLGAAMDDGPVEGVQVPVDDKIDTGGASEDEHGTEYNAEDWRDWFNR